MFVGREKELKQLNRFIENDSFFFGLIYGRRRVGKSELVKQLIKDNDIKILYYECKQVSEASNVESLCIELSNLYNLPTFSFKNIEAFLDYIFQLSLNEKFILILDEYPYLRENIKGLDSIIQSLIDKYHTSSRLKFIILGSYMEIMKSLLMHENPLYGRVDLTINLKPLDYYDSAAFYPYFSDSDKVKLYSVFGGIPYYNRLIDNSLSVKDNIINLVSSADCRLENEISMYLKSEIAKITNANEVFTAIARGSHKFSDILSNSHVSSSPALSDILNKLIQMEVIEKTAPINQKNNKKRINYNICDNLSLFYYRYIFRNLSARNIMDEETFYNHFIDSDFNEQYVPHLFENICKQYLIRLNRKGMIEPVIEDIGKYYYDNPENKTNGEFDIVTLDEKGYIFYEAKFTDKPVDEITVIEEIEQVNKTDLKSYRYGFFSKSGFNCEKKDDRILITLSELYK